jgi:tight adherence protein C
MILILLIGLTFAATAVALVMRLAVLGRADVENTLRRIRSYGFSGAPVEGTPSRPVGRQVDAVAAALGSVLAKHLESFREEELRVQLQAAGMYTTTPRKFLGYRLLLTLFLPLLWVWFVMTTGISGFQTTFGFAVAVAFGWLGPMVLVRRRSRMRLERVDEEMPELIDLLVTMVEAGVGFSGSLQLAAHRLRGPLGEELRLAVQEQNMGLGTEEALTNMAARADTPSMRSFVRAIVQGETLGVSIGKIMRDLALEMRKRRRQMAEERAQKAPTKMLFPLIFLIFPAMFVVILGPAAIEIVRTLAGGK